MEVTDVFTKKLPELGEAETVALGDASFAPQFLTNLPTIGLVVSDGRRIQRVEEGGLGEVLSDSSFWGACVNGIFETGERLYGLVQDRGYLSIFDLQSEEVKSLPGGKLFQGDFVMDNREKFYSSKSSVGFDGKCIYLNPIGRGVTNQVRVIDLSRDRVDLGEFSISGSSGIGGFIPASEGVRVLSEGVSALSEGVSKEYAEVLREGVGVDGTRVELPFVDYSSYFQGDVAYTVDRNKAFCCAVDLGTGEVKWKQKIPDKLKQARLLFVGQNHAFVGAWNDRVDRDSPHVFLDISASGINSQFEYKDSYVPVFSEGEDLWVKIQDRLALVRDGRVQSDTYLPGKVKDHAFKDGSHYFITESRRNNNLVRVPVRQYEAVEFKKS